MYGAHSGLWRFYLGRRRSEGFISIGENARNTILDHWRVKKGVERSTQVVAIASSCESVHLIGTIRAMSICSGPFVVQQKTDLDSELAILEDELKYGSTCAPERT